MSEQIIKNVTEAVEQYEDGTISDLELDCRGDRMYIVSYNVNGCHCMKWVVADENDAAVLPDTDPMDDCSRFLA